MGQTRHLLNKRFTLDKSVSILHPDRWALAEHIHNLNNKIDFHSVKILAKQPIKTKRISLEKAYIFQEQNSMKKKTDLKYLNESYSYLLTMDLTVS